MTNSAAPVTAISPPVPWKHPYRGVLSVLLLLHVAAVALAPLHFATQGPEGASPLTELLRQPLRYYTGFLYLEHGYFFFAPNPGPNHLVRYKVEFADGREPVTGVFPDLKTEWPRLLYHRHFMLSESLNVHVVPREAPPEPPEVPLDAFNRARLMTVRREQYEATRKTWAHQRQLYDALAESFVQHLESVHPGGKATITRVQHRLPSLEEVHIGGRKLNDPDLYFELTEEAEALPAESGAEQVAPPRTPSRFGPRPLNPPGNRPSPLKPETSP